MAYTIEQKQHAIIEAKKAHNIRKTADALHINTQSICNWIKIEESEPGAILTEEQRTEIDVLDAYDKEQVTAAQIAAFDQLQTTLFDRISKRLPTLIDESTTARDLQAVTVSLGIITDKLYQLRGGKQTIEHKHSGEIGHNVTVYIPATKAVVLPDADQFEALPDGRQIAVVESADAMRHD